MVGCRLNGGMGNQMFQIAATIGLAIKNNTDYKVHPVNLAFNRKNIFSHFPILQDSEIAFNYNEPAFTYNDIPYQDKMCLNGYFQSYKYFEHCRNEILDAFRLKYEMNKGVVSIHVRRGDYLCTPDYHPVVTVAYLTKAMNYFIKKGYEKFMVFSDALDWIKYNVDAKNLPLCNIEYSEGMTELQDIERQANCEHQIIANSSFSWWAAWLNQNPEKFVISPSLWFGKSANNDTKDLVMEKWLRL